MTEVAIVANPHARNNREWPLWAERMRAAAPGAPLFETRSATDLAEAARQIARARPRVVAISGGDGTVTHTLTALIAEMGDALPLVSLLGGGAYDSLAPLGGRGTPEDRLRRLVVALRSGAAPQTLERDVLRVVAGATIRCGFRFGVGLPVRFIERLYRGGNPGPLSSALLLARTLVGSAFATARARRLYEDVRLRVALDGEDWPPLPLFGVVAASVAEAGMGLRPFRRATEQPGAFQVLGLTASPRQFARELPRLFCGAAARRDRLLEGVASRLELSGRGPLRWLLDGEIDEAPAGRLVVEAGPRLSLVRA